MTELQLSDLILARDGDREAAERLVVENSGLIWSIVRRFFGRGVEADDLYQLGCLGFLKAIAGFDLSYGTQFSTYAVPKISGEIRRFLRDDGAVKVSRGLKEKAMSVKSARTLLEQRLGREPALSELSEMTGLDPAEIASAENAVSPMQSIYRETGEEGFTLEGMLGCESEAEDVLERISLRQCIDALPEKERQVISLRYYHGLTQDCAARILGVSQVQISRLEKRAMERLRSRIG